MILYFIRHAQSENNALWMNSGSSKGRVEDPEITIVGKQQSRLLASHLAHTNGDFQPANSRDPKNLGGYGLTHLYCSLMVRTIMTASEVSKKLGLPLVALRDLHEVGGIVSGDGKEEPYEGRPGNNRTFFEENFPHLILPDDLGEEGWWNNRPHETQEEINLRAVRLIDKLVEDHGESDDRIGLVTHGAFYNAMLRYLVFGEPTRRSVWFEMNNTGITRVDFKPDNWNDGQMLTLVDYTNHVGFLPKELVT